MTTEQLEHFRQKLLTERARVMEEIGEAKELAREPVENQLIEPGDDPERDLLVDTYLGVGEMRTHEREEIDYALLRIELGEYGICEVCGRPIELERLEAQPTARLCEEDAHRADVTRPPRL